MLQKLQAQTYEPICQASEAEEVAHCNPFAAWQIGHKSEPRGLGAATATEHSLIKKQSWVKEDFWTRIISIWGLLQIATYIWTTLTWLMTSKLLEYKPLFNQVVLLISYAGLFLQCIH